MINFKYTKKAEAVQLRLIEEKVSRFTGSELLLSIGKRSEISPRRWTLIARQAISFAKQNGIKEFAVDAAAFGLDSEQLAIAFEMANYEFVGYKTLPSDSVTVETVYLTNADEAKVASGQIIAQEINACRTLANTPGGEMVPKLVASEAKKAAQGTKVAIKALGRAEMKKLGMNAVLGVAQGSAEEPQFIIAEYMAGPKTEKPIVLVGKGVTFDTGGLNLKPSNYIYEMHMDMSGGAAVIHAVIAAAKLGIKKNIVALVPAVENMPSGSSYRPGDVIKTMSGKTIEVLDTDAEGRVILSDALTYAERYSPRLVVDVATLTGAAEVALGQRASAIFTKDLKLENLFRELGEQSGDYVWPLPLWDEYEDDIKGTFGDWANLGKKPRAGGAITAAIFLYQFAKAYPWVHIDMAPRMTAIEGEFLAKGAAGSPVRLLIKLLEQF